VAGCFRGFTDETLETLIEAVSGSLAGDKEAEIAAQRRKKRILIATAVVVFLAVGILGYWRMKPPPAAAPPVTASVVPAANSTSLDPAARRSRIQISRNKTAEIKTAVNPKDGQKIRLDPSRLFHHGCSAADNECKDDEKPAHTVKIPLDSGWRKRGHQCSLPESSSGEGI